MQGRISNIRIELTCEQQDVLNSWLRKSTTPAGLAKRARAVLMLASGETFHKTSEYVGMGERHISKWAKRFIDQGIDGLYDAKRPGRPPVFSPSSGIVSGEDSLRTTRYNGTFIIAVGLHRVSTSVNGCERCG